MILRAYRRRKDGLIGDVRFPQDFAAALLCAPITPLEYRIAQAIAYRQFQFTGEEAAPRTWLIEDFMAIGLGCGRSAAFAAIAHLVEAKVLTRTNGKGGRSKREADYLLAIDPATWRFPETVRPRGRFEVVSPGDEKETVRESGRFSPPQRTVSGNTVHQGGLAYKEEKALTSNTEQALNGDTPPSTPYGPASDAGPRAATAERPKRRPLGTVLAEQRAIAADPERSAEERLAALAQMEGQ